MEVTLLNQVHIVSSKAKIQTQNVHALGTMPAAF